MSSEFGDNHYLLRCSQKTLQSYEEGFFTKYADTTLELAGKEWLNDVFGKLKTDKERIRIIFEHQEVKEYVVQVLSSAQEIFRKKDAEFAHSKRLEAEKAIRSGNNLKALVLYSQSVIRAPNTDENKDIDNGATYALALWGRGQVLMSMKKYRFAISDIELAMKENLPNEIKARAHWKLAFCYQALGEYSNAKKSFDLAEELTENKDELEDLMKNMDNTSIEESNNTKALPQISEPRHPDFPCASKKIKICQSQELGRYAVASERISTGDNIAVEPPYVACIYQEAYGTHCQHCFVRLVAPLPCPVCASVAFCSQECRDIALSSYHKYECKYLYLMMGAGISILSHTALRMITQQTLERSLELYSDRSKEKVYSLCTNADKRKPEEFFRKTLMALLLLRILQKSGYFKTEDKDRVIPTEEEFRIGELLLLHLQIVQFNNHEIEEIRYPLEKKYSGWKPVHIGVGLYPTMALFNHECYQVVDRYFIGKNMIVNALRPIGPGEVVAENYGPVFTKMCLKERQNYLQGRYWFECKCKPCTQNWPSYKDGLKDVLPRIRCPTDNCDANFTLQDGMNYSFTCPTCKNVVDLTENIETFRKCREKYQEALNVLDKDELEKATKILCELIETLHRVLAPPYMLMQTAEELLATCYAHTGSVSEILLSS